MKKLMIIVVGLGVSAALVAQTKAKPKVPAKAPVAPVVMMKTGLDSLSYALGLSLAQFYKQQGIKSINTVMISRAINDAMRGQKVLLNEEQMNSSITNYLQKMKSEKASGNKQAGQTFLAANKTKQGIVTLPSGLQYQVVKEGTGPKPTLADTVKCHYHGTLIDGTIFDSSVDRGQPIEFPVSGVIKGWTEALQLMPSGSKWKLFIPSDLGYGDNQAGAKIGPGSTLVFDVELIEIVKRR